MTKTKIGVLGAGTWGTALARTERCLSRKAGIVRCCLWYQVRLQATP